MPLRGTSCGGQRERSKPSNSTMPRLRGVRPMIARSVVVFPTPLRPSSAAHSPAPTSKLTPCRMCSLPMWTWTSRRLSKRGLFDEILVLGPPQIGLAHAVVGGDLGGAARGEDLALRHHRDVVGDPEDDLHVVLDDDDVDAAGELADLRDGALGFSGAHAARRLVEEEQAGLGYQRHP